MVASVPVVAVASVAHSMSVGSGGAAANHFCFQPEVAAGCNLYLGARTGVWYSPETWLNAGLLNNVY